MQKAHKRFLFFSLLLGFFIITAAGLILLIKSKDKAEELKPEISIEFKEFLSRKLEGGQERETVSLIAMGDISYSRGVSQAIKRQKDINYPFTKIKDILTGNDIVFTNLETTITDGRIINDFEMVFRSDPGMETALKNAGVNIVSLANNHLPDFGKKGIEDTVMLLNLAGISHAGAGLDENEARRPAYVEKKGLKFAFLAYNDSDVVPSSYGASNERAGTALMDIEKMKIDVQEAKRQADFVIVSMHSGTEYANNQNQRQTTFARSAIDQEADLVLGHHPHVIQPVEKYRGKFIFYSLGNFIFDQMWSRETRQSLVIRAEFDRQALRKIYLFPVFSKQLALPEIADENEKEAILKRLNYKIHYEDAYRFDKDKGLYLYDNIPVIKGNTDNILISLGHEIKNADLDRDGHEETYTLEKGKLEVREEGYTLWQSPADFWIDSFLLADLNNDGQIELALSLWKSGSFGSSKPFWVKENDKSVKNHLFLYRLKDKKPTIIWGSSNLPAPNCKILAFDLDGDGQMELAVLEGEYESDSSCRGKHMAVWKWNGWGFSNEARSAPGKFLNLAVLNTGSLNLLTTETD